MKKISIEHLSRVEGCGGITATIDGFVVTDVKFIVNEGPRLIEKLVLGKTPEENVNLVPRICAICSISHKYAAIRALEKTLSVKVPPKVTLLRELMHLGEMIESHSLHIYLLALPDYLGFPSAIAMASKFEFETKIALEMKQFGNHIMKIVSGRFIHGENPVIGGFGKFPSREELVGIKNKAIQFLPHVIKTVKLFAELNYPDCPEAETLFACLNPEGNEFGFVGDEIILSTGEKISVQDYKSLTNEFIVSHSYCKRSSYQGKPYSVGALARINNLGERLKGESGKMYKEYFNPHWKKNPLYNSAAQALETLYSFERIPEVIDELLKLPDPPLVEYTKKEGKGAGAVEAPRGTLFDYYEISKGQITFADIITPTAQNAEDIERYCYLAAQKLLEEGQEDDKIRERMDLVVRSFDPCISCSVHMVQLKKAPEEGWKEKFASLKKTESLVFVGVGKRNHGDDGAGIELALKLREQGVRNVWLEDEIEEKNSLWESNPNCTLIFLDAVDFGENPGKIALFPLQHVFWNSLLSHKLMPFIPGPLNYHQLKKSFVLGIQPESIGEGESISRAIRMAMKKILYEIRN